MCVRRISKRIMLLIACFICTLLPLTDGFRTIVPTATRIRNGHHIHNLNTRLNMVIPEITSAEEFESMVSSNKESSKAAIMLFKKLNCKPCQKIAPQLAELIEKYKDKIDVYEIRADTSKECLGILKKEGVRTVPTFQFYKGGEKVDHVQGARIDEVEEMIKSIVP